MIAHSEPKPFNTYAVALCVIWAVSLALALITPASWDVAWRIEISERILNKALLYRDIIELNPPLWFWSALPSTLLAKTINLPPYAMLCIAIHVILIPGLWLLDRCVAPLVSKVERAWLVTGALVAMLLVPINDIGQREPPVLLAGLLWACLVVRRAKLLATPIWLVAGIVLFSAYGFALKHYYLVIPIGLEIWLIVQQKRAWRPIRSETLGLAGLGVVYGVAVLQLAPNFLSDIVPLIQLSYDEVRSGNVADPWRHPLYLLFQGLLIILPVYFLRDIIRHNAVAQVLLMAICLHVLVVFLQGKGFSNHFLAAKGTALVIWAFACGYVHEKKGKFTLHPSAIVSVFVLLLPAGSLTAFAPTKTTSGKPSTATEMVIYSVKTEPKKSRVFTVSTNAGLAFYLQWIQGRPYYSRYYAMWMLPGLLTSQLMPDRKVAATAQLDLVRANTIADIRCAAPHLIVGDTTTHGRNDATGFHAYDIKPMTALMEDADFKTWLNGNYDRTSEQLGVTHWRAKSRTGPASSLCPANHP
jgi:hypothetical protein